MSTRTRHTPRSTRRRPLKTTALALLTTASLLVVGCGTGGDDASSTTTEAGETSTTEGTDETTTTSGGDADETTTTEASDGEVTKDDLEALLPEASDIGPGYSVVPSDDDDGEDEASGTEMLAAMEKACPDAVEFFRSPEDGDETDAAIRSFADADGREVEVKLDPTPNPNFGEGQMAKVIDAVNSCTTIELDNQGYAMAVDLVATPDDTYGDRGVRLQMLALMSHPQLPAPLELDFTSLAYVLGSVAVSIEAAGAPTGQTAADVRVLPGDVHLLDELAAALEPEVEALQS
ncbi:MAG: hypothetical protein GX643_09550 [Acidimicrobiales bacterium]|nr:hypothetical protein [Acidimicrobiales bacterium]